LGNTENIAALLRTVSSLLHPPLLDEGGLLPSLKWYLEAYGKRTGTRIETSLPPAVPRLPHETEIALFRVVQECVTTIMRHLGASRAKVSLTKGAELTLKVQLDAPLQRHLMEVRSPRGELGVGIAGMRERLRQLGGTFDLNGVGGETVVTACIPIGPREGSS
jgi:signal transduction histidine kinase